VQSPRDRPPPARRVGPAVQQEQRLTVRRPLLVELDLENSCFDQAHGLPFYDTEDREDMRGGSGIRSPPAVGCEAQWERSRAL